MSDEQGLPPLTASDLARTWLFHKAAELREAAKLCDAAYLSSPALRRVSDRVARAYRRAAAMLDAEAELLLLGDEP